MRFFLRKLKKLQSIRPKVQRKIRIIHKGEHFDLKAIYDQVNERYFESQLNLHISWAGSKNSMPRTRVMFGSYDPSKQLIRIHRRLDQAHVPYHFVAYVIYHEMLHHVLPPIIEKRQKRKIHHPAFKEREKQFQEYALAKAFHKGMKKSWFQR